MAKINGLEVDLEKIKISSINLDTDQSVVIQSDIRSVDLDIGEASDVVLQDVYSVSVGINSTGVVNTITSVYFSAEQVGTNFISFL